MPHLLLLAGLVPAFADDLPSEGSEVVPPETIDDAAIPVITVTAERWDTPVQAVPISVSVVSGDTIETAAITHAEDVIRLVPNVDWVGASNRPRFLLIRGVGDLGTGNLVTNPSVGLLVDEVDLSGLGAALVMLDVDHVEVLRGPQGTLYGPNALGGLIKVESRAPTADPEGRLELRYGSHRTFFASAAASSRITRNDVLTFRAAAQVSKTRGFVENAALDRDDTGARDEIAARVRLRLKTSPRFQADLTAAYVDVDDGYDHWSMDNTRTTWSDRPGEDDQRTYMGSLQLRWDPGVVRIVSNTSLQTSLWHYTADYDWFSVDAPRPEGSTAPEDYTVDLEGVQDTRQSSFTQEIRLSSRPGVGPWKDRVRWLVGLFSHGVRQKMAIDTLDFGVAQDWAKNESTYRRLSAAGFGQLDVTFFDRLTLTAGGRIEGAWQDYEDLYPEHESREARPLYGWRAAARVVASPWASVWASASQSSKLGGFNLDPGAPVRTYRPETDRSYELGLRTQDPVNGRWTANLTGFYVERIDQQLSEWVQRPGGDSADIFFYTDNADRAHTLGAEIEATGSPVEGLVLQAAVGLLDARIDRWAFGTGESRVDYSGNVHAHAPPVTFSASVSYDSPVGVFGRVGVTGAGRRFLANNDLIEDGPYALLDARLGWRHRWFGISVWGRNITNTTYAVAGFGPYFSPNEHVPFGNYYRWADPATWGVSVEARL